MIDLVRVGAVERQGVKMHVQVQRRAEALDEGDRTAPPARPIGRAHVFEAPRKVSARRRAECIGSGWDDQADRYRATQKTR
jgi:hypothetical protein